MEERPTLEGNKRTWLSGYRTRIERERSFFQRQRSLCVAREGAPVPRKVCHQEKRARLQVIPAMRSRRVDNLGHRCCMTMWVLTASARTYAGVTVAHNERFPTTRGGDTHVCTLTLARWPVAETWRITMRVPPCPHALHGREPSCILRRNMHVCALCKGGHARGAPVAGHGAQAPVPSMRRSVSLAGTPSGRWLRPPRGGAFQETPLWLRCIVCTSSAR